MITSFSVYLDLKRELVGEPLCGCVTSNNCALDKVNNFWQPACSIILWLCVKCVAESLAIVLALDIFERYLIYHFKYERPLEALLPGFLSHFQFQMRRLLLTGPNHEILTTPTRHRGASRKVKRFSWQVHPDWQWLSSCPLSNPKWSPNPLKAFCQTDP